MGRHAVVRRRQVWWLRPERQNQATQEKGVMNQKRVPGQTEHLVIS